MRRPRPPGGEEAPVPPRPLLPRPLGVLGASAILVLALAFLTALHRPATTLSDLFFLEQDRLPLALGAVAALAMGVVGVRWRGRLPAVEGRAALAAAAAGVFLAGWLGARLVFRDTAVSADEMLARFDATILAHGRLFAPVAPALRAFEPAMATSYLLAFKDGAAWSSAYLPGNAALQALFMRLGDADLANAALAAGAVVAAYGCARRLWPDHPRRAPVAALLLASSPQVVVTAMTPYAMTAHLALDLAWLWLLLHPSWRSQALAGALGFLGVGLHQVVFHPLFAAPFVLRFWTERAWGRAAFHTGVYLAAGLFWSAWFPLAARLEGLELAPHVGSAVFTFLDLVRHPNPQGPGFMAENLARFIAWQNLLLWPAWLFGAGVAWRGWRDGASKTGALSWEQALALVPVLTVGVVLATQPYQGHGWGYRYLHGALGAMALTAAAGWTQLLDRQDAPGRRAAWAGFVACLLLTLGALLPLRIAQAAAWTRPIAAALAEMRARPALTVVVAPGLFYGLDLPRNDPFGRNRPRLMAGELLSPGEVARLCAQGPVSLFTASDGVRLGMRPVPLSPDQARRAAELRAALADPRCR